MIRPLRPTDMPSYLAFARTACLGGSGVEGASEGKTSRRFLEFLSRSFALESPRQTWVYANGRSILGMASVKSRPGAPAWEVDRFLGAECPDAEEVLAELLDHLAELGGEEGVQKIFLRLPVLSPLLPVARRAGFFAYCSERVYRSDARTPQSALPAPFKPRRAQDHLALFQHYARVAPARTRQAEAVTLQEWRWSDGWQPPRHFRFSLARGRRDFVWSEQGHVRGWLRIEGRGRMLRATLDPLQACAADADAAVAFATGYLAPSGQVYAPVRDYLPVWESALTRHGFVFVDEYALTVKQLTVRVGEHCLVPVGV